MLFSNIVICDNWLQFIVLVSYLVFSNVRTVFGFQVTGSITMDNTTDLSLVSTGDSVSFTFTVGLQVVSESERCLISIAGDSLEFLNKTQLDDVSWFLKDEVKDITYTKDSLALDFKESVYPPVNRQDTFLAYMLNVSGGPGPGSWTFSGTFRMFVVAEVTSGSLIRSVMTITILQTSHETSAKTVESNYYVMPMADVTVVAMSPLTQPILGLFMAQIQIESSRDVNNCDINVYTSPEETSKEIRLTVQKLAVSINDTKGTSLYTMMVLKDIVGTKLSTLGSYQRNMGVMPLPNIAVDESNVLQLTVASDFIVRVEDYSEMKSGDEWPVLVGVGFSNNLIWVGEISVNISAPKVSLPDLVVELEQVKACAYDGNTTAVLEVLVQHSVNSTGTAYNATVNLYLPPYMNMRKNDFTVPLENTITVRQENNIIVTEIGRLTFSDPFTLEVTLDVDLSNMQILAARNRIVTVEAIWGDRWGNLTDLFSDAAYLSVEVSRTCSRRLSWTTSSKCQCPHDAKLSTCGCCVAGACPCGAARPRACAPCGEMWRCVPYKAGFEDLLYLPKSAVTDAIRCDAFHMRRCVLKEGWVSLSNDLHRGSATGVSCHKVLSTSPARYLELSPRVAVVTGINPTTGCLYGISNNGLAYMVSKDGGTSWTSIMDNVYANVTSDPVFIRANITHVR